MRSPRRPGARSKALQSASAFSGWLLAGLLSGCVAAPPAQVPLARSAVAANSSTACSGAVPDAPPGFGSLGLIQANGEYALPGSRCAVTSDVTIRVNGDAISIAGSGWEESLTGSEQPSKLTDALLPCAADHHFVFAFDPKTTIAQVQTAFLKTPIYREHSDTVRVGSSPARAVQRYVSKPVVGHWVRLTAVADGFVALELARDEGQEQAPPRVEREVLVRTLPEAFAFTRSACAKHACVGLIFMPAMESPVSLLDAALAAAGSQAGPPLMLALRDPRTGGVSDDLMDTGRLPPEVIQRVVRASYGQFAKCYDAGLARNPALQGMVRTRFVIDRDGEVRRSEATSTTNLPDCEVVKCVVDAYTKLHFPKPYGGIVTVVYPVMLSPG